MKDRFLGIYPEGLSTAALKPLEEKLQIKYNNDDLRLYHIAVEDANEFLKDDELGFSVIFFDTTLDESLLQLGKGKRLVKGIYIDDEEVKKFLTSL